MTVTMETEEMSMLHDKLIFGITIDRVEEDEVDDIIDDVFDQLADDGFAEEDWDWLVWFRGETCFIVMYAPLLVRASLLKVDGIDRIRPLSHTAKTLNDNRNTWFYPLKKRNDTLTLAERAAETLSEWQQKQYALSSSDGYVVDDGADLVAREVVIPDGPLPRRKRKNEAKVASADELMQMLNLQGATDTKGQKFVFGDDD